MKKLTGLFLVIFFCGLVQAQDLANYSFFQTDIREAISNLSMDFETTILLDPNIAGYVTVEIKDKPFTKALEMILMPFGYAYKQIEDYYLVGVPDPSSGTSIHLNDTFVMKTRYLNAKNLVQLLPRYLQKFVSFSEQDQSLVVINAPPKIAGVIANAIRKIDMGRPEMIIEVKVVQLDTEVFRKWGIDELNIYNKASPAKYTRNSEKGLYFYDDLLEMIFDLGNENFSLVLNKAITEGKAQVVANAKLSVISGMSGTISGKLIDPLKLTKEENDYTGFSIKIVPFLMTGKKVRINADIELKDRRIVEKESNSIISNKLMTDFILNLDQEGTIGSFNYSTSSQVEIGVPLISKIPGIGMFFKTKIEKEVEQQLIFLVNCHASGGEIQ
ncbi:MAG TPA: hypothetical protein PKH64_09000 [Petrotogaceae bacterium]|jgi:type IV pilus assembly protein PilQ|nr:hypothetical protein [Petrotogaceae bacterium]HPA93856.1 hypothetical protein [Petrotogaceae bacterium]HPO26424.1 hypothetical protein [Petrotogaceae bacterium]HQC41691.1 hypothetical protein [Petrotogaceae bacterium]HQO13095.1 hypothetical protein [Petrotogaceae bacterium]